MFGPHCRSAGRTTARSPKLRQGRIDPSENGSFTELGKDAPCFSQMLDGKGAFSLTFIKKAKDHFSATDMMTIRVKLRVASNLGNKLLNRRTPNE